MFLNQSPTPNYFICAKKVFVNGEEHVTRIYERSVLILMTLGILRFLENGKEVALSAGDYYIQRERCLQEGLPLDEPPEYIYIEFNGAFSENSGGLPLHGRYDGGRVLPIAERLSDLARGKNCNAFTLSSYMLRIFGELASQAPCARGSTAYLIKSHIESEYANDITLRSLSKKFGYTEDYISRLFKSEFSVTPHRHLINTRLEQAMWLLENTEISAEKISVAVGYHDFSSFWRAFKARFHLSPSEARKIQDKAPN